MRLLKTLKTSYYVPGTDPSWARNALKSIFYRRVPDFPRTLQLETRTGCNASCIFCPISDKDTPVPKGRMDDRLFEKIIQEVGSHGKTRRISPYLTNEPFVDKTILAKSRFIKATVPSSKVVVTTNAGVLRPEIVDDIVSDNPFHAIYISFQGMEKAAYERTMRGTLVFEETKKNVEYLIAARNKYLPKLDIVITMVETNQIDADAAVRYWKSFGVAAKSTVLENRGGNVASSALAPGEMRIFRECTRLFKNACITFDGDMVLCCVDYYRRMVLGNVRERTIFEVWNSPRALEIRRNFLRGTLQENPLCANCQIAGEKRKRL